MYRVSDQFVCVCLTCAISTVDMGHLNDSEEQFARLHKTIVGFHMAQNIVA